MAGVAAAWGREALDALERAGLRRSMEAIDGSTGAHVEVVGRRLVNFSSNDYLGLSTHPALASSSARAARELGTGAGASRLVTGDSQAHRSLERAVARALGTEAALVFGSGYAANVGLLSTIAGPGDVIFSDALNHASIIDGCRLSRASVEVYPHLDAAALDERLSRLTARRKVVVTESLFSMDGDLAPLPEIVAACARHGAALVVDEAHALGVIGATGLAGELGLAHRVDLRVGTFGKAVGAYGAFVAGARDAVDWLANRARSFVFSTALPPPVCAAAEEGLHLAVTEATLRERLWRNIRHLASGLTMLGWPAEARGPIFPIVLGSPERALEASARLREAGLLVKAIRPPTVPEGTSRLRISLGAAHDDVEIEALLSALARLQDHA
jgi:8-amino-7-oxononanoate synthase